MEFFLTMCEVEGDVMNNRLSEFDGRLWMIEEKV